MIRDAGLTAINDQLSSDVIQRTLKTRRLGRHIVILDCTESTNDIAWMYAGQTEANGVCVLTEQQTAGRGRRGRVWHSTKGQSILCSVVVGYASAPLLTLAAPVAVAEMIAITCGLDAVIKWPNDILLADKKNAGILVESRKLKEQTWSVIGIGINVHQTKTAFDALDPLLPATSLDIETGQCIDRNRLVSGLLERLEYHIERADANPDSLVHQWQKYNRQIGTRIELESDGKPYRGTCIGIDPMDGLIVQLDGGPIRIFHAAHTSILKNT